MSVEPVPAGTVNTERTVTIADAFHRRLCFICADVLNPANMLSRQVAAEHIWVGPSPKFLCVLLCGSCYRVWLAGAYISSDAHVWPSAHFKIAGSG